MSRLAWSPSATITPTWAGTLVRSDLASLHVGGADACVFVEQVAPLLDGTRDLSAIQAALTEWSAASVAALMGKLLARGLVEDVDSASPDVRMRHLARWCRVASSEAAAFAARVAEARVGFTGREAWIGHAVDALSEAGLGGVRRLDDGSPEGASLVVAGIRDGAREAMSRAAERAHRARVMSLWAHLDGATLVLGPLVHPGETACRVCTSEEAVNPRPASARRDGPSLPGVQAARERLAGSLVAMEVIKIITGSAPSRIGGRVLVQDLRTREASFRTLVRVPWCRVCG